jgi:hypothetical protein
VLFQLSYEGDDVDARVGFEPTKKAVLQTAALDHSAIARKYQIRYSKISSTF